MNTLNLYDVFSPKEMQELIIKLLKLLIEEVERAYMIKKCEEHAKKTCFQVIAEGLCIKDECRLFKRVVRMIPKFRRLNELMAQGVEPTTIWDFSEKAEQVRRKRKVKAKRWLNEYYPNIMKGLQDKIIQKRLHGEGC